VPNDVYIAGGAYEFDGNDEQGDGPREEAPSIVICTGANACGKVCDALSSFLHSVSDILRWAERLPETGESNAISNLRYAVNDDFTRPLSSSTWHK